MKIAVLAVASLIAGAVVGGLVGRQEFAHEVLPIQTQLPSPNGSAPADKETGPRLTILTEERYDFGEMDRDSTMTHTFEIRNDGTVPLTVTEQGTSCKCTTAGLNKDQLQPGEKAQIKMEWNAKNAVEPFEQYAEYRTNDLRRPRVRLVVFGRVLDALSAEPKEAIFNRVSALEPARAKLKIYGTRTREMAIVSHTFSNPKTAPFFHVEFRPLTPEEVAQRPGFLCGVELTVGIEPGLPLGQVEQSIQITTNLNPDATFEIPVYGSVVSDISLAGQNSSAERMVVYLGSFSSSQGATSTVYLVVKGPHRDQTELKIAEVSPNAELTATLGEPIRDNPQIVSFPVTLAVPKGTTPVSRLGKGSVAVRVETTHPQLKELTFFVRFAVVE